MLHFEQSQRQQIIQRLPREPFDPAKHLQMTECTICWNAFVMMQPQEMDAGVDESVSTLPCNGLHFFHTRCLMKWINDGNRVCPLCRQEIQPNNLQQV